MPLQRLDANQRLHTVVPIHLCVSCVQWDAVVVHPEEEIVVSYPRACEAVDKHG